MILAATSFAVSFALPFAVRKIKSVRRGSPARVVIQSDDPKPNDVVNCFTLIAQRLDEMPQKMRIIFDVKTPPGHSVTLDLDKDGALLVKVGSHRVRRIDLRRRWIADHNVPMTLKNQVLYVEPVEANRFRVMERIPFGISPFVYAACSIAASAGLVFLLPVLIASSVGLALGCYTSSTVS